MLLSTPVLRILTHLPKSSPCHYSAPRVPVSVPVGITYFIILHSSPEPVVLNLSRNVGQLQHPGYQAEVGSSSTHSGSVDP